MTHDAKKKALKKKTGEQFGKNPFAAKYKENNEAKDHARRTKDVIPGYLKRK